MAQHQATRMRITAAILVVLLAGPVATPSLHAAGAQYRRWISPKSYQCVSGPGYADFFLGDQNVEFASLPTTAQFTLNYFVNGVLSTNGPYTVEKTSGTMSYGSFLQGFPGYPLDFDFRIDTLIGGYAVYRSSIHAVCYSDASGSMAVINRDVGPSPTQYRRWSSPKTISCTNTGGTIWVNLDNQNVEFNDLPANAQFINHYIDNGVDTPSGPFTVEQTSGTKNYSAFAEPFASYPLSFQFRIDTLINGVVAYHSAIGVNCSGDAAGIPGVALNLPERIFASDFERI